VIGFRLGIGLGLQGLGIGLRLSLGSGYSSLRAWSGVTLCPSTFCSGIRNICSQDYSFPGTFVPWTVRSLKLSFPGLFVPWTIHSREWINTTDLSLLGPFVPWTIHSLVLWFQVLWTFPAADHSFIYQQSSTWSTYKEGTA